MQRRRLESARREQKRNSSPPKPTIGGSSEFSQYPGTTQCNATCPWKVQFHQIGSFSRHLSSGLKFLLTLVLILALAFATCAAFIVFCRKCDEEVRVFISNRRPSFFPQTKNTALCPTLLHLDASSHLGIIGTKSVESNSSQQSLAPGSGGFSGPQSEGGNSRGSTEWGRGQGGRGGRVDDGEGTRRGGGGGQVAVTVGKREGGSQAGEENQEAGRKVFQSELGGGGLIPTQSTKSTWRFSRTTTGPSTTTLNPLRADLDSVLSAVIRWCAKCLLRVIFFPFEI